MSYLVTGQGTPSNEAATTAASGPVPAINGPVVVYVEDLKTGALQILIGTTQRTIRDKALAAQIARAAG